MSGADISNGVGNGNKDNTGIKITINLAGLHQEGKITKEIAIAIIERFIRYCENSHEMKSALGLILTVVFAQSAGKVLNQARAKLI